MKTKELIKLLQEADPEGECVVYSNGYGPIYCLENLPGYYDGPCPILIQDPANAPYYNVVGYKFSNSQPKLRLRSLDLEDALLNDPDLPVEYEDMDEDDLNRYKESENKIRSEMKRIHAETDAWAKSQPQIPHLTSDNKDTLIAKVFKKLADLVK